MSAKLDELRQLKEEGDKVIQELNRNGVLDPEAEVNRLEETIEAQKMSIQAKQSELDDLVKSAEVKKAQNQELAEKVSSMKLNVESEEKRASELRALLEQKRVVYNNQQQRKESFCLVSGNHFLFEYEIISINLKVRLTLNAMSWRHCECD